MCASIKAVFDSYADPVPAPEHLTAALRVLTDARDLIMANHPDHCMICCAVVVPLAERVCSCAYIACCECLGKCPQPECPGCRKVPPKLIGHIVEGHIRVTLSQLFKPDFSGVRPVLEEIREKKHARIIEAQQQALSANNRVADQQRILDEIQGTARAHTRAMHCSPCAPCSS